jgi:phenylalanyl-tRNA synthetase beta chain
MAIPLADQQTYLERLGFAVAANEQDLEVTVPPDRHYDVTREVDLIEEVGRVHGLDEHLPSTLPAIAGQAGALTREQHLRRRAEDAMRDLGFDEVVGWSFTDPDEAARLRIVADDPRANPVVISNPLSEDQSVMRTTLLGSLLDVAQRNLAHGADRVALFESGRAYLNTGLAGDFPGEREAPDYEPQRIGCLAVGPLAAKSWRGGGEPADFFALKGALEALAGQLGVEIDFDPAEEPFLHPGRAARVSAGGEAAGWLGEIHPLVCRGWDVEAAAAFEIDLANLLAAASAGEETFDDVTTYPAVHQDIAVVVPVELPASELRAAILAGGGDLLRAAEVFDLYEGEQVGEGRKSIALRLEFRAVDRTLVDEEVAERRTAIEAQLEKIRGELRG